VHSQVRDRLRFYSQTLGQANAAVRAFFAPCAALEHEADLL
jgi:hypothetical protein